MCETPARSTAFVNDPVKLAGRSRYLPPRPGNTRSPRRPSNHRARSFEKERWYRHRAVHVRLRGADVDVAIHLHRIVDDSEPLTSPYDPNSRTGVNGWAGDGLEVLPAAGYAHVTRTTQWLDLEWGCQRRTTTDRIGEPSLRQQP